MLTKFKTFAKKQCTLSWITFGLCVVILAMNFAKGNHRPHGKPHGPAPVAEKAP